jgi:hypothetical protein
MKASNYFLLQGAELVYIGNYEHPVKLELDDDDGVKAWRFTKKKDVVGEELD